MPVRTLIVDDSPTMRAAPMTSISGSAERMCFSAAPEPHAARQMIKELDPDVLTLDVEMPGMDGLSFLEKIMRLRPMPVVMCSTLTAHGADATIEALRIGAVDFVTKPNASADAIMREGPALCRKVRQAARSHVRRARGRAVDRPALKPAAGHGRGQLIAIGASTGGVESLFDFLPALPADMPPIVIVQHMPGGFTNSFAQRLDRVSALHVEEATNGAPLKRGTVYIAPGGAEHLEVVGGAAGHVRLRSGEPVSGHRPSVDVLFHSVAPLGAASIGLILTGMGADGADGLRAMRTAGARTLGQSEDSCVVYGMPKAAAELGAVEKELSLAAMPEALLGILAGKNGS